MKRLTDIPKTKHYAGMTRHHLGEQRYVQVCSAGPEAQEAIKRWLEERK